MRPLVLVVALMFGACSQPQSAATSHSSIDSFVNTAVTDTQAQRTAPQHAADRVIGVTVDDISNLNDIVESLQKLPQRVTVRLVFNLPFAPDVYRDAVKQISKVADILGQPADSVYVAKLSLAQYGKRFEDFLVAFPEIELWEIGNEINGHWLGTGVPEKLDAAFDLVKGAGRKAVVVPYWNTDNCKDKNGIWLPWLAKNVSNKVKAGADYVLVSVYGMDCDGPEPTATEITAFYQQLGVMFPNAKLGLGEIGAGEKATLVQREAALKYYLLLPKLHPRDIGFLGYWWFKQDMVPKAKSSWSVLADGMR